MLPGSSPVVLIAFLLCSSASAVDFPIVYCRVPLTPGESPRTNEVQDPVGTSPGTDLVLWRPDGTETVLFDAGDDGGVFDPCVDFQAEWIYFSYSPEALREGKYFASGADLYRVRAATGEVEQITHGELTPHTGEFARHVSFHCGACVLPGGRLMFTSNRNDLHQLASPDFWPVPVLQLFVMDLQGKNVEQVGYFNLGAAQHPVVLCDGRVMFSSGEWHGLRNAKLWGLWAILPDGRHFEPLWSAFDSARTLTSFHFCSQTPDRRVQLLHYYPNPRHGFGNLYDFQPGAGFGHPDGKLNPPIGDAKGSGRFPFQPESVPFQPATRSLTPWSTHRDDGPPYRVGYPAGAPGGLLMTLVHFTNVKPVRIDSASVVFLPTGQVSPSAESLEVAFDHPRYLEMQPRPVVRYRDIYGIDEPEHHEWLPSETAEPFGYVGTSGVYARETKSFVNNTTTKWGQGGDVGEYHDADIHAIRILVQRPTPRAATHKTKLGWTVSRDERMAVLGEIPLRKFLPGGSPILDSAGDPDTSFLAKIPADTSFTFQLLNRHGQALNQSMTWHHVRPGEWRTDCRGCHAHHQPGIDFEGTEASKSSYTIADLAHAQPEVAEWFRDVKPLLARRCGACHNGSDSTRVNLQDDDLRRNTSIVLPWQSLISPLMLKANHQRLLPASEFRQLALWIDIGAPRADTPAFFSDHQRPTLFVRSPARDGETLKRIEIGASDIDSPPVTLSVRASWNLSGQPGEEIAQLFARNAVESDVWTLDLPQPFEGNGQLVVTATDAAGQQSTIVRSFMARHDAAEGSGSEVPPQGPPRRVEILLHDGLTQPDVQIRIEPSNPGQLLDIRVEEAR